MSSWEVQGSETENHSQQYIHSHVYQVFIRQSLSFLSGDIEPVGSGVVKHWGHIDLPWNFKIAGKVRVLNDNYCVEVQLYWQHNVLEAIVIQNSQCLLLWNILVPRYYCITMVPWPTAPLPIKQHFYVPCIYAWTTVEYIRALTFACTVPAGFCFLLPCFKAKAVSEKTIETH